MEEPMLFPLRNRPTHSYRESPCCFAVQRKEGRLHAGCDLYAPAGTEVLAMADGAVLQDPYDFFRGTKALEIDHGAYVARYSEISDAASGLRAGSAVSAGQVIGYVGQLQGLPLHPMLHLEIYDKGENKDVV